MSFRIQAFLNRRQALAGVASAAAVTLAGPKLALAQTSPRVTLISDATCRLTPQATEGPYYFDPQLERVDIREDREGMPLDLALQIVAADDCGPISGARADIWHCDATGHYSGYARQGDERSSTAGETYLRGTQFADTGGVARFRTIYPGWYRGRTTHIHFKVFFANATLVTGQIYFQDAISDRIYAEATPYNQRSATRDTWNADDGVLTRSGSGPESFVAVAETPSGLQGSLVVGVAR